MTGIRVAVGYGKLVRDGGEKISELPKSGTGRKPPLAIIEEGLLGGRFGAGVEVTINRNRNLDYKRDLGFREITMVTPGMYDVEFSMEGYVSIKNFEWLKNIFFNESIVIDGEIDCYDYKGTVLSKPKFKAANEVYLKMSDDPCASLVPIDKASFSYYMAMMLIEGSDTYSPDGVTGTKQDYVISEGDFNKLKEDAVARGTGKSIKVEICGPGRLNKIDDYVFDIGTVQNNLQVSRGKSDEVGVLCGCVLTSAEFSYEATGDSGVKFSLDGIALRDYIQLSDTCVDYLKYIDDIDSDIFATGCLSIAKKPEDFFEEIAHTDSASLTITNTVEKLAECGELVYGGLALGELEVELAAQTYSNDPNRYIPIMYGMRDEMEAGGTMYTMQKLPKPAHAMRIRSSDKTALQHMTKFLDIVGRKVYIESMNRTFATDSKVMDEPTLKPMSAWIAIGYEE